MHVGKVFFFSTHHLSFSLSQDVNVALDSEFRLPGGILGQAISCHNCIYGIYNLGVICILWYVLCYMLYIIHMIYYVILCYMYKVRQAAHWPILQPFRPQTISATADA